MARVKPPILWVDDTPDQPIGESGPLRLVLEGLLSEEYELRVAKNRDAAVKAIEQDTAHAIRLVLMDIQFPEPGGGFVPEQQGQAIAKKLFDVREAMLKKVVPEGLLKFIVMTSVTSPVSLGNQGCKIEHIVKESLTDDSEREYFTNLVRAIVSDFGNTKLSIEWSPANCLLNLKFKFGKESFERKVGIQPGHVDFLGHLLAHPNMSIGQGADSELAAKVVKDVNDKIRKETGGRIWGIITRLHRGQVMAVVPAKNITGAEEDGLHKVASRLAKAAELERVEDEMRAAIRGIRTDLDELLRWRRELAAWKKDADARAKEDHEWLVKQGSALSALAGKKGRPRGHDRG